MSECVGTCILACVSMYILYMHVNKLYERHAYLYMYYRQVIVNGRPTVHRSLW